MGARGLTVSPTASREDATASWQLERSLVPDSKNFGNSISFFDVPASFNGRSLHSARISFFSVGNDGGIEIFEDSSVRVLATDGPQLYSGSEDAPTFLLGTFAMTRASGPGHFELTISAVPEPASLALVLAGLGLAGFATARPRRAG